MDRAYQGILNQGNTNIEYIPALPENVNVGFTKDYSFNMSKHTFDKMFLIVTFIIAIFFVLVMIIMGIVAYNASSHIHVPPVSPAVIRNDPLSGNVGGVNFSQSAVAGFDLMTEAECKNNPNSIWNGISCECKGEFFGKTCSQTKHDKRYFNMGKIGKYSGTPIKKLSGVNKSFTHDSCSSQCHSHDNCNGFIYENGNCILLDELTIPEKDTIHFDPHSDSTLFFKKDEMDKVKFSGKVFLSRAQYTLPSRYWIPDSSRKKDYAIIKIGKMYTIHFKPEHIVVPEQGLIGIYSKHEFTSDDVDSFLEGNTDTVYLHFSGKELKFPFTWNDAKIIHVAYVRA